MRLLKVVCAFVSISGIMLVMSQDQAEEQPEQVANATMQNTSELDDNQTKQRPDKNTKQQQNYPDHVNKDNKHHLQHYPGPSLISFDAVGKSVALGLDYLVPFLEVPVKRKRNAPPRPLVIVNSAAIISCGLVAAGGLIVGHLIRNLGLESPYGGRAASEEASEGSGEDTETMESSTMLRYRGLNVEPSTTATMPNPINFLEHFKLVYKNESGSRVVTTLPNLFGTIEQTFLSNDINLAACVQKSLCTLVHKSRENVRLQRANDLERLIDGAVSWSWLMSWLQQSTLYEAVDAAKRSRRLYCDLTYPACKWAAPEQRLWDLLRTNVRFA